MVQNQRVAVVTGGAVGIGRAICARLAADGVAVAIGYHSHTPDGALEEIEALGGIAIGVPLDVTDRQAVADGIGAVVNRLGSLDILVNNAGGLVARRDLREMTDDHWDTVIALNLTSTFACTRAAAALMTGGGRIINVSSLAAQNGGGQGAAAYAAAKAGVIGLTRAAAKELGARGITVNAITPGFIGGTPFHDTFSTPEAQQAMVTQAAVARAGDPSDMAALVSYLASAEAGFINGVVIDANGGSYFT